MQDNSYHSALQILDRYYGVTIEKVAESIIEKEDSFAEPYVGGVEDFIENSARILSNIGELSKHLRHAASTGEVLERKFGVHEVDCNGKPIASAVNEWLGKTNGTTPFMFSVVKDGEDRKCLILYEELESAAG